MSGTKSYPTIAYLIAHVTNLLFVALWCVSLVSPAGCGEVYTAGLVWCGVLPLYLDEKITDANTLAQLSW